jgi:hypothetical protein
MKLERSMKAIFSQVSNYLFIKSRLDKIPEMSEGDLLDLSWNEFCGIVT